MSAMTAFTTAPTLWLARHATVQAPSGLCYGAQDWPARPMATRAAAQALAAALPAHWPSHWPVWASPRWRCQQLAQALAALRPDLPAARVDARLCEMDFGLWEGRLWAHIERPAFDAWMADFAHHRPGGGESVAQLMQRVASAWADWRASGLPALWLTHAGVMRAALLLSRGQAYITQPADWPQSTDIPLGSSLCLQADGGG